MPRRPPILSGLAAILSLALAVLPVAGVARADEAAIWPGRTWLLGDWGGLRTRLLAQGVDFQIGYVSEVAYNAAGGISSLVDYTGQAAVGASFDLERLVGLHDARFQVTYTGRAGRNLSQDAGLDTLQLVQEVYGRGQTVRLTEMWFEQKYFGRAVSWKSGRMTFGGDFATFPCDFQNLTFCGAAPGNLLGNYIYNWPISQWATRVQAALDGVGYVQVGAYDQNSQYLGYADKLLPVFYPGSVGVLVPVELAWQPTFGRGTLPGSYKLGGWYSSATAQGMAVGSPSAPPAALPGLARQCLYGFYLAFQQQVTRNGTDNPRGGLNLFLNAVVADSATSILDRQFMTGFTYTGPFAARPDDAVAFAAGTTRVSSSVSGVAALLNAQGLGPLPTKIAEYVFELDYAVAVRPGLQVRPNVQYILSEGGRSLSTNVWVLGLKTVITF